MRLAEADRGKLGALLAELCRSVEELLLSGLTTASEATRRTLDVSFQESARMRLLRLGSTLRAANDELGRFTRNEEGFSRKRLCFFLNRAWLLSHGLARALREGDERAFDRLLRTPAGAPVERLEVVTLGVLKRVAPGSFAAFEFRLRAAQPAGPVPSGGRLMWSCVFPLKAGSGVLPEALLHLPQKQQFTPTVFLEKKLIALGNVTVTPDESGCGRISLGEKSTVTAGEPFLDWARFGQPWDPAAALERLRAATPGPLDLDVELQEEVVLPAWQVGQPEGHEGGQSAYPISAGRLTFEAVVPAGDEGKALRSALERWRKPAGRPPLFGLLHYERCRLVLQPLAVLGKEGPEQLMLSAEKVDRTTLLKALKF
jgi:hypothetical protein